MVRSLPVDAFHRPTRFAHIVMRTSHFEEKKTWYATVLGAEIVTGNPFVCFLTYDDEHHRLAFLNTPDAQAPADGCTGIDHIAYAYPTMGELLQTFKRLKAAGIEPYWSINHGPTTSLYYRDPDGVGVELQVDNYATPEELRAWMETGAFEKNPIGVEFNPDKLAERYEAGDPIDELILQGSA